MSAERHIFALFAYIYVVHRKPARIYDAHRLSMLFLKSLLASGLD